MDKEKAEQAFNNHVVFLVPLYSNVPVPSFISINSIIANAKRYFRKVTVFQISGTLIQFARKRLLHMALDLNEKEKVDYVFWIDSDQVFDLKQVFSLVQHSSEHKKDFLSGFIVTKQEPFFPTFYFRNEDGDFFKPDELPPKNTLIDVDAAGFGFFAMKMEKVKEVVDKFGMDIIFSTRNPKTGNPIGEDLMFCGYAKELGNSITVDTSVQIGHFGGVITPDIYYAVTEYRKKSD